MLPILGADIERLMGAESGLFLPPVSDSHLERHLCVKREALEGFLFNNSALDNTWMPVPLPVEPVYLCILVCTRTSHQPHDELISPQLPHYPSLTFSKRI
jgi:hypothetical protein